MRLRPAVTHPSTAGGGQERLRDHLLAWHTIPDEPVRRAIALRASSWWNYPASMRALHASLHRNGQ